jgi:hypothetical protein
MATRNPYYIQQESQTAEPIDWNTVIGDLSTRYRNIKKDREGQREALDALVDTNTKILQATQIGKSPNTNEFILRGTESGRGKLNEWNKLLKSGQLSPSDYKNKINNLMDSWNQLAITTKTYDERMQEIFKNQQPDENGVVKGSALELERANELAQYQDLKNKTWMFDDQTGKGYLAKINADGILDPTSVTDPRSLNNFASIIDNKVQLPSLVDAGTEGWKTFKIENGQTTVNDIRQNKDAYAKAKATLINGILSNNSAIASVLTDYTNDEYDYYSSNDDFLSKVQKRIQTENYARELNNKPSMTQDEIGKFIESQRSKFILLSHDDQGILQPQLTEAQIKAAFDTVDAEVEIRMGKEETMDEPYRRGGSGGGGGGGSSKSKKPILDIAQKVYGAVKLSSSDTKEAERQLNAASGGKFIFKYSSDGLNVYKEVDKRGEKVLEKQNSVPFKGEKYADNLWPYFPVEDKEWVSNLEKLRQGGGSKTYSSAQEANIKATLKANPGASRADVIKALGY